jgi:Glycosyl transferases group 1
MTWSAAEHVSMSARRTRVSFDSNGDGTVLLYSMRQVADLVGYVALYEFEDLIAELTNARVARLASLQDMDLSRRVFRLARAMTGSSRLAESIWPATGRVTLSATYDVFLPIFNHPHELFALHAIRRWRERCRFAACYLCEAWEGQLPFYLLELLRDFDHVFVGVLSSVEKVAAITGRPCTYLPMGVDALTFCPYPSLPARSIDVCGIGRRSPVTHQALLDLAREQNLFYYYDTIQSAVTLDGVRKHVMFCVSNPREHRMLLASLLKRTRYFIANRAWADQPALTRGKDEIAARFYEGAAAGTIMLGDPPNSDDFRNQFDWQDPVIPMPFDAPKVASVIAELDADQARSARIRRDSVVNALLKHDWVYRLRVLLGVAGVRPTDAMLAREASLRGLADDIARMPMALSPR